MNAAAEKRGSLPGPSTSLAWRPGGDPAYRLELCAIEEVRAQMRPEPDHLSVAERDIYRSFKFPKRRHEWLAGRLAAKRLLRSWLLDHGRSAELSELQIFNRPSGEPYAVLAPAEPLPPISISHTSSLAACALAGPGRRVGVDLETVQPRDPSWLRLVAHGSEAFTGLRDDPKAQTSLWSLKEAVLKVLGVGLSVPLLDVRFHPDPSHPESFEMAHLDLSGKALDAWHASGSPNIQFETSAPVDMKPTCVLSVAFSADMRGKS